MVFSDLENILSELAADLKPAAEIPADADPFTSTVFDCPETDHPQWIKLISGYLDKAKVFEIHCWNEETEWIELALQYGRLKDDEWKYGKIITGNVTPRFTAMLLSLSRPENRDLGRKMTPFFNVFLDDRFQSCHYGMENYHI